VQKKVEAYEMAPGIAVLYLGVRADALGPAGQRNTNYWVFPSFDMEQDYAALREGRFTDAPSIYITLSSNKDPSQRIAPDGVMNLQVMALAPSKPEAWGLSAEDGYRKNPAYMAQKEKLQAQLLARAEAVFPGLREAVVYEEMATPLTHARYTLSTGGTPYGLAATPAQFDAKRPGATTHLPGLLLAGASTRNAHGVLGAVLSGKEAATAALTVLAKQPQRHAPRVHAAVPATVGHS
jgi:phytoene dehydrogenase-like protein